MNNELERLRTQTSKMARFIYEKTNDPSLESILLIIESVYKRKSIKSLKTIEKDLKEWAKGFPVHLQSEFNLLFENVETNNIQNIINNGFIANDDEFRDCLNRVEEIYNNTLFRKELQELNKLLSEYEK